MFKNSINLFLLILVLAYVQDTNGELSLVETVLDEIAAQMFRMGDVELGGMEEDMVKAKQSCEKTDSNFLNAQKDKLATQFKGLVLQVVQAIIPNLSPDKILICQYLKRGEDERAKKTAVESNKHIEKSKIVRYGFMTILKNATQEGSKMTIPEFTCYLKKFSEEMIAVHPDKDGSKTMMKSVMDTFIGEIIKVLEIAKGKAADNCQLPKMDSNPSEYHSFVMPIFKALDNLDK